MSSTTFSYAQAAKGHTIPQPSPQLTSSSAPPSAKDDALTGNTSVTAPSVASNDAEARDVDRIAQPETESALPKQDSEAASIPGSASSTTTSVTEQSVKTGRESDATMVDSQNLVEDKGSRSASRTSRLNDGADGRKGRKGKKDRNNEKDAQSDQTQEDEKEKETPKPVLSEALPPAVNVWTQRREAQQQAKAKVGSTPAPAVAASPAAGHDLKKRRSPEDTDAHSGLANGVNGDKAQSKPAESVRGTEQHQRRSAPRGSRVNDKGEKGAVALPPVADATFWPDPKSAASTEEPARKLQEKVETEKTEKEGQEEAGTSKKKWVNLDIVPTVVFSTPIPLRGGAKARGGARGGREVGSARGNHGNALTSNLGPTGDRPIPVNGATGPKNAASRPREGSIPLRTGSQSQASPSHPTKRASFDEASKDQRKLTLATNAEQGREFGLDASASTSKRGNTAREGRSDAGPANFEAGSAQPRAHAQERPNNVHQKSAEYPKDGANPTTHTQPYAVREGRPDRGRGGGYRARGGHNGAGSHLPSTSYAPNGQYAVHAPYPARQNAAAVSPPPFNGQFPAPYGQQSRGRGNKWPSQASARNGNGSSFTLKPAHANDFQPAQQYAPPAAYAAPYPNPAEESLIAISKTQIEYYLSVENLCKDRYLRQQLDSQGFVKLSVIAGFKRMQELHKGQNPELLRIACTHLNNIDFVIGDDNVERLRLREKWAAFVLPWEERLESAQNEGPRSWNICQPAPFGLAMGAAQMHYGGPVLPQGYAMPPANGMYASFPDEQMYQAGYANGLHYDHGTNGGNMNGHRYGQETQLSAVVPDYSPPFTPLTLEGMTALSNEKVEELRMPVDAGGKDSTRHNGVNGTSPVASTSVEVPTVNGEMLNGEGDVDSSSHTKTSASATSTEQSSGPLYTEFRDAALKQRESAQPGETSRDMQTLYGFWVETLRETFNSDMYLTFREVALADAQSPVPAKHGLKRLMEFYESIIYDERPNKPWPQDRAIPSIFQQHFQEASGLDRTISPRGDTTI
ncbi:hypothetical protein B0T25DRAFT_445990 [Lasiosphaeria hispida]|uniref:HTH La-type RNA-binding domain-containing protein n=1 Tax=Lasiosphaeria hispida TaxID=260671 RepID=A0AAJ0HUE7_9PEZI|nr:hypothetical protein B0T25DRAFT_445990 [Lasiosphaeria hispida]